MQEEYKQHGKMQASIFRSLRADDQVCERVMCSSYLQKAGRPMAVHDVICTMKRRSSSRRRRRRQGRSKRYNSIAHIASVAKC